VTAWADDIEDMVVVMEGDGMEVVVTMAEGRVVVDAEAVGVEAETRNVQGLSDPHALHMYRYICSISL
jgi:hypothetical protein